MLRSTGGCTRTSSAGSASRARSSASARSSPGRSCARATALTSSATRRQIRREHAAPSRTDGSHGAAILSNAIGPGHGPVVERLVESALFDPALARDLAERAAGRRRLLDDLGGEVVADEGVESRRGRERQLGIALAVLAIRLDAVDALLGQEAGRAREEADRVEEVPGDDRHEDVQL